MGPAAARAEGAERLGGGGWLGTGMVAGMVAGLMAVCPRNVHFGLKAISANSFASLVTGLVHEQHLKDELSDEAPVRQSHVSQLCRARGASDICFLAVDKLRTSFAKGDLCGAAGKLCL